MKHVVTFVALAAALVVADTSMSPPVYGDRVPGALVTPPACLGGFQKNTTDCSVSTAGSFPNFVFSPDQVLIAPGVTVYWVNNQAASHTTTSDGTTPPNHWDSGTMSSGAVFPFTFDSVATGRYTYHCTFHQPLGMVGTILVQSPTVSRLIAFSAVRHARRLLVTWQLARTRGIAGFRVFAGRELLTPTAVPVRAGQRSYHISTRVPRSRSMFLEAIVRSGGVNMFGPYRIH